MSTDMRLLDDALPVIIRFARYSEIEPDEFTFRHLQYEFLLSKLFQKAYGDWDHEIFNEFLSDYDRYFGISLNRDSLLLDSGFIVA
jgi:hypothetical protein